MEPLTYREQRMHLRVACVAAREVIAAAVLAEGDWESPLKDRLIKVGGVLRDALELTDAHPPKTP